MTQNTPSNYCGTTELSPQQRSNLQSFQQELQHSPEVRSSDGIKYYLPIKLHIVGRSDGTGYADLTRVLESICILNDWYEGSNIQFFLEDDVNYIDNDSYYEHDYRQGTYLMFNHAVDNKVNVFVVADAAGNCGYYNSQQDAVAITRSCLFGETSTTLAHEIGHYLSMPHTFDGWEDGEPADHNKERADGSNCTTAGDGFCDTPADYLPYRWQCPYNGEPLIDPVGDTVIPDATQIMSYSSDECQTSFSSGQQAAMRNYINNYKQGMVASNVPYSGSVAMPNLVKPVGESAVVPSTNATFSWKSVDNSFGYQLQVSRFSAMVNNAINVMVTDTSFSTNKLEPGVTYYWRVRPLAKKNTCTDFTNTQSFKVSQATGIQASPEVSVNIFPNPVHKGQSINIQLEGKNVANGQVELVDLSGKVIQAAQLTGDNTTLSTNLLSKGVYLVRITTPDFNTVQKVSIQ